MNELCEVPAWRRGDGKHVIPETEGLGDSLFPLPGY